MIVVCVVGKPIFGEEVRIYSSESVNEIRILIAGAISETDNYGGETDKEEKG
jgi:hypothetical protein